MLSLYSIKEQLFEFMGEEIKDYRVITVLYDSSCVNNKCDWNTNDTLDSPLLKETFKFTCRYSELDTVLKIKSI